ncbi:MAG: ribose-5-phosphate isomerase RpiA [SAR324 cluster bacterium]|nr:ribose-5-phosphate isomerase RpiA [SAR324 cluster bacterium]
MRNEQAEQEKKIAGEAAVSHIQSGMIVGLGTGSTVYYAVRKLGELVRNGLSIQGIPTSKQTHELAIEENIPLIDFSHTTRIDLTIDGADEVNPQLDMIKGGGGALLREKIVASVSNETIIAGDSSKLVSHLGKFPLPVEVTPFGWQTVAKKIETLGAQAVLREQDQQICITDNQMYVLDCHFEKIEDPQILESQLNKIPGVVITGLFIGLATRVLLGDHETVKEITVPGKGSS